MKSHYDVAIIDYGPTGATLANLLGQYGVSVVVVEREADIYDLPRAVHFDDEIMRIFQTAGFAEELLKKVWINPGMRFVDPDGKLLLDWPRPAGISSQGWNTSYRFHQPDLERILRKTIEQMDNVVTLCSHRLVSVEQGKDTVALSVEKTDGGNPIQLRANYVVGCDRARSIMRPIIGTEMEDFGFREKWLVVDVKLTRPPPRSRRSFHPALRPARLSHLCTWPQKPPTLGNRSQVRRSAGRPDRPERDIATNQPLDFTPGRRTGASCCLRIPLCRC